MATREENLKKINDELEMLTDDELEQVVGGGTMQTCGDNDFLQKFGYSHYEGHYPWNVSWKKASTSVDKGWSEAGITCVTKWGCPDNLYFLKGKQISRKEAFAHVLRQKGFSEETIASYNYGQWRGSF